MGAMHQKIAIFKGKNSVWCGAKFSNINDLVKNLMGAMHQKIAIFKGENSVCSGAKFSNITKWHYFLDELNLKLKNKTCQEISNVNICPAKYFRCKFSRS